MTEPIAALIAPPDEHWVAMGVSVGEMATGGTLFGSALSMAAGRAALEQVLTPEAFQRSAKLGAQMADGLEEAIRAARLPCSVARMGPHAYYAFAPEPPHSAIQSREDDAPQLRALIRVWMANRGVWESGWWLGPTVSVAHTEADVARYVELFGGSLAEATERGSAAADA